MLQPLLPRTAPSSDESDDGWDGCSTEAETGDERLQREERTEELHAQSRTMRRPPATLLASAPSAGRSGGFTSTPASVAAPLIDWSAPLSPPQSAEWRAVHKRGLFFLQSHFHTLLACNHDEREASTSLPLSSSTVGSGSSGASGGYSLSSYPGRPEDRFPSVFNVTIALSGHVAAVYIVDALLRQRLQLSAGRLLAWKEGERREKRRDSRARPSTVRPRRRAASRRQKKGSDEDSEREEVGPQKRPESVLGPSAAATALDCLDPSELSAGLTFCSLSAEPANPRSMLFYFYDPLSQLFLSAKKDRRVTVRVSNKTQSEQWRLLPIGELGLSTLSQAAAARTQWNEARNRQDRERRERDASEAYVQLWPEQLCVGSERLSQWRDERRCESRDSYAQCSGEDGKRLHTLHFDYRQPSTDKQQQQQREHAESGNSDCTVSRFSAGGVRRRMQPAAAQWWPARTVQRRQEAATEGRYTERVAEERRGSGRRASGGWDPSADISVHSRTLQRAWRAEIELHCDRQSQQQAREQRQAQWEEEDEQDRAAPHNGQHDRGEPSLQRRLSRTASTQPALPGPLPPLPAAAAAAVVSSSSSRLSSPAARTASPSVRPLYSATSSAAVAARTAVLLQPHSATARLSELTAAAVHPPLSPPPARAETREAAAVRLQGRKRLKRLSGGEEQQAKEAMGRQKHERKVEATQATSAARAAHASPPTVSRQVARAPLTQPVGAGQSAEEDVQFSFSVGAIIAQLLRCDSL